MESPLASNLQAARSVTALSLLPTMLASLLQTMACTAGHACMQACSIMSRRRLLLLLVFNSSRVPESSICGQLGALV